MNKGGPDWVTTMVVVFVIVASLMVITIAVNEPAPFKQSKHLENGKDYSSDNWIGNTSQMNCAIKGERRMYYCPATGEYMGFQNQDDAWPVPMPHIIYVQGAL